MCQKYSQYLIFSGSSCSWDAFLSGEWIALDFWVLTYSWTVFGKLFLTCSSPEPAADFISGLLLENRFKYSLLIANKQHNFVL